MYIYKAVFVSTWVRVFGATASDCVRRSHSGPDDLCCCSGATLPATPSQNELPQGKNFLAIVADTVAKGASWAN